MPKKDDPVKFCKHCGNLLVRKRINGRLEDRATFIRRNYCDRACMAAAMVKDTPTVAGLRWRAARHRGDLCEICGTGERLQVHHLNGDIADNDSPNLMTLCASCHAKWHWENGKTLPKRQPVCIICGAPARKLGMCQKHYQRYKKYGNPYLTKTRVGQSWRLAWDRG